jgi:hypothetical protein
LTSNLLLKYVYCDLKNHIYLVLLNHESYDILHK